MTPEQSTPFFSIVLPTYNRANFLPCALASLSNQTFADFEIIVVDDGSDDATNQIVAEIRQRDRRIRYYHKENEERSIARNFGIAKATGRYIGFLDSDDRVYPNHLEVAFNMLQRNNFPEVGHLGFEVIDSQGKRVLLRNRFDERYKATLINENIFHGNAIFIRKDITLELGFIPSPHAILSEDWYLWMRLAARYDFCFDNTVTSRVVHHKERSLLKIDPEALINNTKVIVNQLKKDEVVLSVFRRQIGIHFAQHYTFLALILSLSRARRIECFKSLISAIHFDARIVLTKRFWACIKHLSIGPKKGYAT